MDTRKQALTKPQKTVGVPQKKGRTDEGKGGEPTIPRRQTCATSELAPPGARSAKGGYRQVRLVPDETMTSTGEMF